MMAYTVFPFASKGKSLISKVVLEPIYYSHIALQRYKESDWSQNEWEVHKLKEESFEKVHHTTTIESEFLVPDSSECQLGLLSVADSALIASESSCIIVCIRAYAFPYKMNRDEQIAERSIRCWEGNRFSPFHSIEIDSTNESYPSLTMEWSLVAAAGDLFVTTTTTTSTSTSTTTTTTTSSSSSSQNPGYLHVWRLIRVCFH